MSPVNKGPSGPVTRFRNYGSKTRSAYSEVTIFNANGTVFSGPTKTGPDTKTLKGTQITTSEGHPFQSRKRGSAADIGGDFFTQKKTFEGFGHLSKTITEPAPQFGAGKTIRTRYNGYVAAFTPGTVLPYPPPDISSNDDLDEYGATAVARCKPTNPVVDLTAALAEIRKDGLPSLPGLQSWESKTSAARSAGDEYLNAQFGWLPLASDVSAFSSGVIHAKSVIDRYKAGIGKVIRRSYDFPTEESSTSKITSLAASPWTWGGSPFRTTTKGVLLFERKTTKKRWFRGAFTYYFPYGLSGKLGDYAILARQLGLVPTPETVWNVAPWSWAVDWISNTGDVISNWTSFHVDGLVMVYGYIMEHVVVQDTYTLQGFAGYDGPYNPPPLVLTTETKIRRAANPYGFGVKWDGLSSFRVSILGALGLTKGFR